MKNFKMDSEGPRHIHECEVCKPQHTPTPWSMPYNDDRMIMHENGERTYRFIALCNSKLDLKEDPTHEEQKEDAANAAFIVHAVNAHEELLGALKGLKASMERMSAEFNCELDDRCPEYRLAIAAITFAEGR